VGLRAATLIEQLNPPNYNLPRISHRQRGNFTAYRFDDTAGMGTCIYVLDTGLNARPEEFGTRAVRKATIVAGVTDEDTDGHGTHVAGTVGSKSYGAAKNARIYAVKVFDNSGSAPVSAIMQAAAFLVKDAATETGNCPNGFVVNLSLQLDTTLSTGFQQAGKMINVSSISVQPP
jgi:subtilisin family serine protease